MANTGNTQQQIDYGTSANDGTGDALRVAFIKTDENFDNIWLAGPVGSNITITNNTVQANDTNGNLILSPNGIGVIQTNSKLLPRLNNTYDLGSSALKYRSAFIGSGGIATDGNVTLGNITNLRIPGGTNGYVIQTDGAGNLSFVAQSGSGNGSPGGANSQVQFNNSGLFGASNTFTFSNVTSTLSVGNIVTSGLVSATGNIIGGNITTVGLITATGNVTANYFLGAGSQLTGNITGGNLITGGLVSATGNIIGGNIRTVGVITATGNVTANYFLGNGSQLTSLPGGVIQADAPPSSPNATTLWWDEITGRLYVWYTDVDGSQWVDAAPAQGGYGNSNVSSYLAVGGITTAVSTTGNISGNYFIGNGSQLTGIASNYGNANVAAYLPTYTGNISGGNIGISGAINAVDEITSFANLVTTGEVQATGNIIGGNLITTGSGGDITMTGGDITGVNIVVTTPTALANLTAVAGARAFVNNANLVAVGNFGNQVGSGGSNVVPVWSDGSNWYIG